LVWLSDTWDGLPEDYFTVVGRANRGKKVDYMVLRTRTGYARR